jgi:phenylalanine-4-hydroxylase
MSVTPAHVPPHLRRFVVEQDYTQYDATDQAVWRFVLLQTYAQLKEAAHPAYRTGLRATGISVRRIPSIAEMNDRLARFGWGAVCVDGFIPPRAFQEFQASSILPIAADIRTREHLVYTPAPDIIHEAAGHAPILPDPVFAAYLRRIGELGKKAFTVPEEDRVFRAIYALSEVKENPAASPEQVAGADAEVRAASEAAADPSEAARLSRLYWWTAEYGLVGRTDDYKLYGAGLLSSLGESHSCHDPRVRKVPLDERCVDVPYDITRPQPQLFVTPNFEWLHDVLDRVAQTLGAEMGGEVALERALRSAELASVVFSSGASVTGVLRAAGPRLEDPAWLDFAGPVAFAWDAKMAAQSVDRAAWPQAHTVVTGLLEDGRSPELASDGDISRLIDRATGRHRFRFASGASVEGRLLRVARRSDGRLMYVDFEEARLALPNRAQRHLPEYRLLASGRVETAHAGAADPAYYPDLAAPSLRVPKPRVLPESDRILAGLFEQAEQAHRRGASAVAHAFPRIHEALERSHPEEWLLRWNMLESLLKVGDAGPLARALRGELERLEVRLDHREPIASGLRYLDHRAA